MPYGSADRPEEPNGEVIMPYLLRRQIYATTAKQVANRKRLIQCSTYFIPTHSEVLRLARGISGA